MSDAKPVHFLQYGQVACMKIRFTFSWPEGHLWSADWKDVTCPDCLRGQPPYPETFRLVDEKGTQGITCLGCGRTSYNANDVENHYCAWCGVFHDDLWPPARQWLIEGGMNHGHSPADLALQEKYSSVPWLTPLPIHVPGVGGGFACRLCIVRFGTTGSDVKRWPQTEQEFERHLWQAHGIRPEAKA